MPEMDGIATMREARKLPSCRDLPIIAVTAKAMKGDRERCIEAGAWDYLSKPVDPHHLLAVLRSWLLSLSAPDASKECRMPMDSVGRADILIVDDLRRSI